MTPRVRARSRVRKAQKEGFQDFRGCAFARGDEFGLPDQREQVSIRESIRPLVAARHRSNSFTVMCPMMQIWAPVATIRSFLVSGDRFPWSQTSRRMGESVLPSGSITFNTEANLLNHSNRLSGSPGSERTSS